MAQTLIIGITALGYDFLSVTSTNQIFPVLPNKVIEKLQQNYAFYVWAKPESQSDNSAIRLCTSWATPESAVNQFLEDLKQLS
jgi:threonine aldolase